MGGHAFEGVSPVNRDTDLAFIMTKMKKFLNDAGCSDAVIVGSAGKKQFTSDVDLAVDHPLGREDLFSKLKLVFGEQRIRRFGANTISLLLHDPTYLRDYQVDVMIGNINYLIWARYSDGSVIKGVVRNLLLNSWNRHDSVQQDAHVRIRKVIDWDRGLMKVKQTKLGKSGNVLKEWKTVESTFISDNPLQIVKTMFGSAARGELRTFKEVVETIFLYQVHADEFFEEFYKELYVLLEQTPHLLGSDPHKAMSDIKFIIDSTRGK